MHNHKIAAAEAVLFSMGHEVRVTELAQALDLSEEEMGQVLGALHAKYYQDDSGLTLLHLEDHVQLCAKPKYYETLIRIVKKPKTYELTDTLLETLAIIAYRQPVTRLDIEKIRGVKSDYAVGQLIDYGLICEKGRMEAPGKPLLFGTTDEFLRHFGFSSLEEMPTFGREELERFRSDAMLEAGVEEDDEADDETDYENDSETESETEEEIPV